MAVDGRDHMPRKAPQSGNAMKICGIDPGLSGALAVIGTPGPLINDYLVMPTVGNVLDLGVIKRFLQAIKPDIVALERGQAMPKQGVSSAFKFGRVCGAVEGILVGLELPYKLVTPRNWQKWAHMGIEKSLGPKQKSLIAASRLYPGRTFLATSRCRKPHEGIVDALLIARWVLETFGTKELQAAAWVDEQSIVDTDISAKLATGKWPTKVNIHSGFRMDDLE